MVSPTLHSATYRRPNDLATAIALLGVDEGLDSGVYGKSAVESQVLTVIHSWLKSDRSIPSGRRRQKPAPA